MFYNNWGIVLVIVVILSCVGGYILSKIYKTPSVQCVISASEDARFLKESIAIQPDNSPVFENTPVNMVIANGMEKMGNEKFSLSQGGDTDV